LRAAANMGQGVLHRNPSLVAVPCICSGHAAPRSDRGRNFSVPGTRETRLGLWPVLARTCRRPGTTKPKLRGRVRSPRPRMQGRAVKMRAAKQARSAS
jgi:hypothetical protein